MKLSGSVDLDDLGDVEGKLEKVMIYEVKSTKKELRADFAGCFFALTGAEVLAAQSLKRQFRFLMVDTSTGDHLEMGLSEVFSRAKGIYPTWSILF